MTEKTFYLIRHAEPDLPGGEKMYLGQRCDLPLSPRGHAQAAQLAQHFQSVPLDTVYTSPLLRARQTAEPIAAGGRALHVVSDLCELSAGEWDGLSFAEVRARYPQYFAPGMVFSCPPGGESDEQGLERARRVLAQIERETPHSALIVAHAALIRLLLCALLGRPLSEKKQLRQKHAAISVLTYADGCWRVESTGVTLDSEAKE